MKTDLHVVPLTGGLDMPTPPVGSCYDRLVDNLAKGYYIYGNYEGDESLEHFLGFANYNQRKPCTGFGMILGRKGLPVDAEGNPAPLFIGLTTLDEISGDGIYQPENWSKAGVLYPEDLPEPDTWYWVYLSFLEDPYPDTFHTLIATTNAYFEEGTENYWLWGAIEGEIEEYPKHAEVFRGWEHGGWSSIPDMLCFFTWTECEVTVCTNPPGVEGQTDDCGVGYGGQPSTVHKYQCSDGTWIDLGRNCPYCPDCPTSPCSDYIDELSCIEANCEWWNNKCHGYTPICIELDNKVDCERYNCYWYNDSCHAEPRPPTDYLPWIAVGASIALVGVVAVVVIK